MGNVYARVKLMNAVVGSPLMLCRMSGSVMGSE